MANVIYIATAMAGDEEMHLRIVRHQAPRPTHWPQGLILAVLKLPFDRNPSCRGPGCVNQVGCLC